jgi:two-component system chemotaxis response regulator CheB
VPIVVTQHMPPVFTRMFAERLDRSTPLRVVEAGDGMELDAGTVYIAPGDQHLVLHRRGTATVTQLSGAPPENSCRPAVDVMFRSVARSTARRRSRRADRHGTGRTRWCEGAARRGAEVLAQDEAARWCGACPARWSAPGWPTRCCRWTGSRRLLHRLKVGRSAAVAR